MAKINLLETFPKKCRILPLAMLICAIFFGSNQSKAQFSTTKKILTVPSTDKGKPVIYNSLGVAMLNKDEIFAGGNHIAYRKHGFGISWRANIEGMYTGFTERRSELDVKSAYQNNWETGRRKSFYLFNVNANYVYPITKKIPVYGGIGLARNVVLAEFQPIFSNNGKTEWLEDINYQKFKLNFGFGVFIPIYNRLILNVGYDHRPQTVFVGLAISGPFNYEDLDMW